ncbi:MAG: 50S ribosomal protein L10 [Chloroflexi bacterium]|nr:50S ribosomal protein L10 [Chloroflexota bacterium]
MSKESREKKTQIIDKLQESFAKSSVSILTDYRGLSTTEMTKLRRRLQESGIEYKVVKNTLARFATERAGKNDLTSSIEGPIAVAFGYDDITAPARVLTSYIRDSQASLSIKGGILGDRLLTSEEVMTLATLPSREILIAKVLGQIQSPISALLNCLNNPLRGFIGVLQARINQLEGE